MKKISTLLFFLSICLALYAQDTKYYKTQPGENILDVIPQEERYEYKQFQQGRVIFKTGVKSTSRLNYNFLLEEMQFISAGADTLAILNPEAVESVTIGNDVYYFAENRFIKLDTVFGNIKLGIAGFFTQVSSKKIGGYGETIDGSADSYSALVVPTNAKIDLTANFVTTVVRRKSAFLGNQFNQFVPLTKKSIFSFYPDKESILRRYFNEHKVDLTKYKDVVALLTYMSKM